MFFPGIQYLRGIAALLVVLMHSNGIMQYPKYFQSSPLPLVHTGLFGVVLFFVISGFIIAIVALEPISLRPRLGAREFAIRRFVRIVPFMWLCIVFYNVLSFIGVGRMEWGDALRALVLWPIGEVKPNVIWSLRHELYFYALFAVAYLLGKKRPWILFAWFFAPFAASAVFWVGQPVLGVLPEVVISLARVFLIGADSGANLQFAAGFCLGLLWLRRSSAMTLQLPVGPLTLAFLAVLGAIVVEVSALGNDLLRHMIWTIMATFIVWLGIVAQPGAGRIHEAFIVLGNASFSIYLLHNPVLLTSMEAMVRVGWPLGIFPTWGILVAIAVICSLVAYRFVEVPLIAALSGRSKGFPWFAAGQEKT